MEMQLEIPPSEQPRRRPWLEILLFSGFILFLVAGILAFAAFWTLYDTSTPDLAQDPLSSAPVERLLHQLALRELAGDPANALAYQALGAGEYATAHVAALYDTHATGSRRNGLLLNLGRGYLDRNQRFDAAMTYRLAASTAILDDALAPLERNQALVQAAQGLFDAGETEAAADIAQQAKLMAEQLPDLLPAQRGEIFAALRPLVAELGDDLFLQQVTELARNPYLTPQGVLIPPRLADLKQPLPADVNVINAQSVRIAAAEKLIERYIFTNGADIGPEVSNLAAALLTENQVRRDYFQQALAAGIFLEQRYWLLSEHRAWIAQQVRIGQGDYGISLVPEWESNIGGLRSELSTTTANIDVVMDQLAQAQATAQEGELLRAEALNWLALQADLGLYPNAPLASISQRLALVQQTLAQAQTPLALPVQFSPEAVPPGYRIIKVP